jgi:hypothetical protein
MDQNRIFDMEHQPTQTWNERLVFEIPKSNAIGPIRTGYSGAVKRAEQKYLDQDGYKTYVCKEILQ